MKQIIAVFVLLALVWLGCTQQKSAEQPNADEAQAAGKVAPFGVTNPQKNYVNFQEAVQGTVVGVLPVNYGYFVSVEKNANVQNPKVYRDFVSTQKFNIGQPVTLKVNAYGQVVGLSA